MCLKSSITQLSLLLIPTAPEMVAEYARPELLGVVSASLFGVYSSTTLLTVYLCLHRGKLATSLAGFQYLCRRSPGQKSKSACRSA